MDGGNHYKKVDDITVLRILPCTHLLSKNWDLFGHSWVELGEDESYGWWPAWPKNRFLFIGMLFGVPGDLNGQRILCGTPTKDPHHRDRSPGVIVYDLYCNDRRTAEEIKNQIRHSVQHHQGAWRWPFGLCCHSFQQKMFKDLNLIVRRK
ncbi:hypothetical protein ACQKDS_08910 [Serratia sp. NPDC078593]|uniref:hypothetical protein n=1 Tax=unclassified Serratia (in: enterobacteria) TaxID=2647522 RepID=UPI0037D3F0D9